MRFEGLDHLPTHAHRGWGPDQHESASAAVVEAGSIYYIRDMIYDCIIDSNDL